MIRFIAPTFYFGMKLELFLLSFIFKRLIMMIIIKHNCHDSKSFLFLFRF